MSNGAFRVLDANVNRCSEALRVLEDYFRFSARDSKKALSLKRLRHGLFRAVSGPLCMWRMHRDVRGDLNKKLDFAQDNGRVTLVDRNCSRVKESLRTLEETLKGTDLKLSSQLRSLRFAFYDLEPRLLAASNYRLRILEGSRLCLILSTEHFKSEKSFLDLARVAVGCGVGIIQYRDNHFTHREQLKRLITLKKITSSGGAALIVNDNAGLCLAADCDGLHVGGNDLPVGAARRILGPGKIIGRTCHSFREIKAGNKDRSDYLSYGTFFPSRTKPRTALARRDWKYIKYSVKPCFAVGGITVQNARLLRKSGIKRIAVCSEVMLAKDAEKTIRKLKAIFDV